MSSVYDRDDQAAEVIEKPRRQAPEDLLPNSIVRSGGAQAAQAAEYSALMELGGREPRDREAMVLEARRIGQLMGRKGFYRFPAGQGVIQGETIDLAYALAQAWGRCITRCVVTASEGNRVTMRGIFVDMLTLAICERDYVGALAPAPARFAEKPDQVERWRTMQEQAAISKAVRGAILGGLPTWYTEAGLLAAIAAADGEVLGGSDVPAARKAAIDHWAKAKFTQADLEAFLGMPAELWSVVELGRLVEQYRAIKSGTTTLERMRAELAAETAAPAKAEDGKDATGMKRTRKGTTKAEEKASGSGGAVADADAGKGGKDEPKSEKAVVDPAGTTLRPAMSDTPKPVTADELRAAEADAGEGGVATARAKLGISMTVPSAAIATQSNARDYLNALTSN